MIPHGKCFIISFVIMLKYKFFMESLFIRHALQQVKTNFQHNVMIIATTYVITND